MSQSVWDTEWYKSKENGSMVRAIRGATTVENNDREEIIEATKEMLETIISEKTI